MRVLKRLAAGAALLVGLVLLPELTFRVAGLRVARAPAPASDGSILVSRGIVVPAAEGAR